MERQHGSAYVSRKSERQHETGSQRHDGLLSLPFRPSLVLSLLTGYRLNYRCKDY